MDLDMAIPYQRPADPESLLRRFPSGPRESRRLHPGPPMMNPPKLKEPQQLLTCPSISCVAYGDIESFFYVLLLFFLSYKESLPKDDLSGFTEQAASDQSTHIATWPNRAGSLILPVTKLLMSSSLASSGSG
ncbi:hypothetical protein BDN67DRAFT_972625 [Paxillus ammoniavirescens]|nr:hypothetical protein BDN67DRAFT_972625 [Paxillus ammoniavirescens]